MSQKLIEVFTNVAVDKIFYPMGAICTHQDDLMNELGELFDDDKLDEILEGKDVKIWSSDIFDDWMDFNEWISEENITGFFASLNIPILKDIELSEDGSFKSGSCSFGYCHVDFIYYNNEAELIDKATKSYDYWRQYDIDKCKSKY